MIASLPMYDRPETAAANDRLWQGVRARLGQGPAQLARGGDPWAHWQSPDLILSQTCGLPYRARLHDRLSLVATPVYDLPDCPEGFYYSVFVVRAGDLRAAPHDFAGAALACNEPLSQSGWAAPQAHAAAQGFAFGRILMTGAHRLSGQAVAEGRADIAAIDALTWALMQRHDAIARDLRVIGRTAPGPGLPYVTARHRDPEPIRAALAGALAALSAADRATLGLRGIVYLSPETYRALPIPHPPAADLG
ncbi:MAG: PhnD/SsuA/transferrin family substrate-binding protein [Roseovarius sp.]|nr:PhnD/SsuA/transferrin family substrate-binding protein [Roseovarius sp.]